MKETDALFSLRVPARASSLAVVRHWVQFVWGEVSPEGDDADLHSLVLSAHEAFRNVIEHSRPGESAQVTAEATMEGGALVVRLIHDGLPFDGVAPAPEFDGTRDGGLGVFLMTQGLSRLAYSTTSEGAQQVELTKETRRPSWPDQKKGIKQ